jgi:hypothetical protein
MQVKARAVPVPRISVFYYIVDSQPNAGTIFSRVDSKKGTYRVANFDVKTSSQWRISC